MPLRFPCANSDASDDVCEKPGNYGCKKCLLVNYCGATCQRVHWNTHKLHCKSPLNQKNWQPEWVLQSRRPAFVRGGIGETFGPKKYLWGNIPAYDVLCLDKNEGKTYDKDLSLLFAASGDIRNVLTTIAHLPTEYSGTVQLTINDLDFDTVARNIILLLISLVVQDQNEAIDCMIHIWYSALVRQTHVDILQERIHPLLKAVCDKISNKPETSILGKTWKFGNNLFRVELEKSSWDRLLSLTEVPKDLTVERAQTIRTAITLAPSRVDYRDRHLYLQLPEYRVPVHTFREDGLLLPFGASRRDFTQPNPTIYQDNNDWPLKDSADPREGWPDDEFLKTPSGPATADIYGKLFYYVENVLLSFVSRIDGANVLSFTILQHDATKLYEVLEHNRFDRIEVSNISDAGWLGIPRTLAFIMPLLQGPTENPHATLITLFMNAVDEAMTNEDKFAGMTPTSQVSKRLIRYLPLDGALSSEYDPRVIKFNCGREVVDTYDHVFTRYREKFRFNEMSDYLKVVMKKEHTIIPKWPFRLKLRPGQQGAQQEFDRLLAGGVVGKERYVEWKKSS